MPTKTKKKVARKRPRESRSGAHKVARKPVMFPAPWDAVTANLSDRAGRPKLHYLLELVAAAATAAGIPHPDLPAQRARA